MANRYWVGGTASWDGTAGTKWAATSGGPGGETVPTTADDVFFDAASGANTVTIATGNTGAKSVNCTGFTGTLTGSGSLTVAGSFTLVAGMTHTYSGVITFTGTGTITSAGKTLTTTQIFISGAGIVVTLADALTITLGLTLTQGTFDTSNFNMSLGFLSSTSSGVRTLNLGSSTVSLSSAGSALNITGTNLTFNAGTSTINFTSGQIIFQAENINFYNLNFSLASSQSITFTLTGTVTCNNLSITAPASAGVRSVTFNRQLTINGVLSTASTAGNRRVWFQSVTYGAAVSLVVNGSTSLTDADFRDVYITGTAAPISGTRIGDLRGNRGITFSTPKSVYFVVNGGTVGFSGNFWALTANGAVSLDNFPLAQDTAIIGDTGVNSGTTLQLNASITNIPTIDASTRTLSFTIDFAASNNCYGDWKNGSGITLSNTSTLTFSGRKTQTITSAGKTFSCSIVIDSYGGTVELADNFDNGTGNFRDLTITNGTFNSKNFNITTGSLVSANSNVRSIILGSSTVTINTGSGVSCDPSTNLDFQAGTSTITITSGGSVNLFANPGLTFNNVNFNGVNGILATISGSNTFNNLTFADQTIPPGTITFSANQTITGTLTFTGTTAVRRMLITSNTLGTPRTLTVGTLVANNMDFRDIIIAGNAANTAPTRAGDCGGNSGIVFPSPKTVYWNLAGTQNWSATGWAPNSGGTPDINQFPLAQDTAIFDNTGSAGTVTFNANWIIGTIDMSLRTTSMTLTATGAGGINVYGDWKFGTGVTHGSNNISISFSGRNKTCTILSNGVQFQSQIIIRTINGTVQLGDALLSAKELRLTDAGFFDALTYNVTINTFTQQVSGGFTNTLRMGSGTWTLTGTGNIWIIGSIANLNFYKGTANILLSDTSTTSRTFNGAGLSYNKLTIGGTTGTSTTTITSSNQFTELASVKTVAHTINFGTTSQTFGAWTVTGTAGNVVTLTGTAASNIIVGSCTSGIDYLAMGSIGFAATSPGEFYAGANSTGTAGAPVYRTAKPADSIRYWVGGTGNWSDTARWSLNSGGSGGASIPRSHDNVIFDSASNATAYTATIDTVTGGVRFKQLTITGPASGNITLAGSTAIYAHDNITLPATGLTRTYNGNITLSGSSLGKTITTNGVSLSTQFTINGVGCEWSLGSSLTTVSSVTITNGSLDLATYNLTSTGLSSNSTNKRTIKLGTGTHTLSANPIIFGTSETQRADLTVVAGTSQINSSASGPTFEGNNQTFYNVTFTSVGSYGPLIFSGVNTFNNLTLNNILATYGRPVTFNNNQTITGTLTIPAGSGSTGPSGRNILQSNTIGTTITLTCGAVVMSDADFRDITIAGSAAPASGTRIGDGKGNSGIVFTSPTTRYWNFLTSANWQFGWAPSSGGAASINNFPLPQDTCIIDNTGLNSGQTISIGGTAGYMIGTIDMSARTLPMTFDAGGSGFLMLGNWINGTGTTINGTGTITFAGRGSQTITSAGKTFTQRLEVQSPGGSVTLQDQFVSAPSSSPALLVGFGTFNANDYSVTLSAVNGSGTFSSTNTNVRTIAFGSGTWTIGGNSFDITTSTNITVTGTCTIRMTLNSIGKTFAGGGLNYSGITLEQAGSGTLTINGNNTFRTISNSYNNTGATTINFGSTTTRIAKFDLPLTTQTNRLTLTGTSSSSLATIVFTGVGVAVDVDYFNINFLRAYPLTNAWYIRNNSAITLTLGFETSDAPALPPDAKFLGFF